MRTTIISFPTVHLHGELLLNVFRARHRQFVETLGWDLPHEDGIEFDQYDTPQSRWVAIHEEGSDQVLAGFRMTPTVARCGVYSYMIRDAQAGLLETIPPTIVSSEAPVCDTLWECSRAFVSDDLPAKRRGEVRRMMIESFMQAAERVGASALITLTNRLWPRWMPMHGIAGEPIGPLTDIGGEPFQAVIMQKAA